MHPADMIFFWGRSNPEQPALIQPNLAMTYRELADAIESVAERLENFGFSEDEPVAVSIFQPIHKLIVCFALLRHGISPVPVEHRALIHLRANNIYNLIFTGEGLMLSGGRNIRFEESWLTRHRSAAASPHLRRSRAERASLIFLAPDATGRMKTTIVPSSAIAARLRTLPLIGETNCACTMILPSTDALAGFCRVAVGLYAGKTACFAPDHSAQILLINTFGVDALVCSPGQAADLLRFVEKERGCRFDSLREIWIEHGPLEPDLGRRTQMHLCRNVITGYGSDEAGRIGYADFEMIADVPGAAGYVVPDAQVEIVSNDGKVLPPGEHGKVRCRTEFYARLHAANHPEQAGDANAAWWYPGDTGHLTADGLLCIAGLEGRYFLDCTRLSE